MKKKGLWWLVGLAVVTVGYVVYDFQSEDWASKKKEERTKAYAFVADQVQSIEIKSQESSVTHRDGQAMVANVIKLVRSPEGWMIQEPLQEKADSTAVQDFVDGLLSEKAEGVATESDPPDWKVFGLDDPRGSIVVKNNLGETRTYQVSSKKNFQGDAFLRRDQENKVYLGSSTWFAKLEKKPIDFRDKRLFRHEPVTIKGLSFQSDEGRFELKYEDDNWRAPSQSGWKLDQNKVRDVLALLTKPVITEFTKEGEPSADELKKWGFLKPRSQISLETKDGKWTAVLARDADAINRLKLSEPNSVVQITAADAEKLASLKLDSFRDRRAPFDFKRQDVKKIEVHSAQGTTVLEQKGSVWTPTQSKPELKVESNRVDGLLIKLGGLEVAEFIDKKMDVAGNESIVLRDEKDQPIFSLKWGERQKKKVRGQDRQLVVAQSNLFPEPVTLDESAVKALGVEELLGMDAAKKESEKK